MTEKQNEQPQTLSVAEMLRQTAGNTTNLMVQIADHIDKLEDSIVQLQHRIKELEESQK